MTDLVIALVLAVIGIFLYVSAFSIAVALGTWLTGKILDRNKEDRYGRD